MNKIFVKKLVSLNPTRYEAKSLEEMIKEYGLYCYRVGHNTALDFGYCNKFKTFSEWLKTEI